MCPDEICPSFSLSLTSVVFCFTVCCVNWTEDTTKSVQNSKGWGALFVLNMYMKIETTQHTLWISQMNTLYSSNLLTQLCCEHVFSRARANWRTRAGCSWCHHTPDHVVQTLLYFIGETQALQQPVDVIVVSWPNMTHFKRPKKLEVYSISTQSINYKKANFVFNVHID